MSSTSTSTFRQLTRANTFTGQREHMHLLSSMQKAARRQETMLKDLHSEKIQGEERVCPEEMLGEIDISSSMDFYPNYQEDIKLEFED